MGCCSVAQTCTSWLCAWISLICPLGVHNDIRSTSHTSWKVFPGSQLFLSPLEDKEESEEWGRGGSGAVAFWIWSFPAEVFSEPDAALCRSSAWKPGWNFARSCCLSSTEWCFGDSFVTQWKSHTTCCFLCAVNLSDVALSGHLLTEWLSWVCGQDSKVLMGELGTAEHLACLS